MSRSRFARLVLILLVLTVVTTPSAWGAPIRLLGETSSFDILSRVRESFAAIWAKARCTIDLHGICVYIPPPTQEAGCILDPHGTCVEIQGSSPAVPATTEAGCGLDPHGVCIP